jgi:hypothetical protein
MDESLPAEIDTAAPLDTSKYDLRKFEVLTEVVKPSEEEPRHTQKLRVTSETGCGAVAPDSMQQASFAPRLVPVEQVYSVNVPDIPPPVKLAHKVFLEIGEGDSHVRILIQERNGGVAVRFDAATEVLRHGLECSAESLMQALHREQLQVTNLDFFGSFGSATDAEHQNNERSRALKSRSGKLFADQDETFQLVEREATDNPRRINT